MTNLKNAIDGNIELDYKIKNINVQIAAKPNISIIEI
jgi:hypothetical protein